MGGRGGGGGEYRDVVITKNQFRYKTASISFFRDDVWCVRSSRAWRLYLCWFRGRFPKVPQTGLNFILSGLRLVHPKLQGMEALFMVVSRSISKSDNQQILLKKDCRKTALISSSRDDVWCIRSSRARRLCLWWSRGRFPTYI